MAYLLKDIIKLQIDGLERLDYATVKRLGPILRKTSENLEEDLLRYNKDTYSYQHRLQTQRSINATLNWLEEQSWLEMQESAEQYSLFGSDMAEEEIKTLNNQVSVITPSLDKDLVSIQHNKYLLNTAKASLNSYTAGVRAKVSNALTQAVLSKSTGYEVKSKIKTFLDIKKYRIQRIVRTELARIYNSTKLVAYGEFKQEFPDLKKRLFHPMDNRTSEDSIQLKKLDPAIPLNEYFKFTYKRKLKSGKIVEEKRVFLTPPDRPNDRASMIPFRDSWKND